MRKNGLTLFLLLATGYASRAQDTIPPVIHVDEWGDSVRLSATLRPLRQLAGAPAAYYSYFWEFGDGHFSFDRAPEYAYRDTGTYKVRLFATNNYDDGKAPPTRPRPVRVRKGSADQRAWVSHFFHGAGDIELKINRNPKPGEDFVTVVGYRNQSGRPFGGSIVLFYNERQFGRDGFAMADERFYNGEGKSDLTTLLASLDLPVRRAWSPGAVAKGPALSPTARERYDAQVYTILRNLQQDFTRHTVLRFPGLQPGQEKFAFLELATLPGMIKDTNATVSLIAMMVPDNPGAAPQAYELDMQVVSSHDPNRMQLIRHRINYRFIRQRKVLEYRVNFQNSGKGPTTNVSIGLPVPPELDPKSIQVTNLRPYCRACDSAYPGESCMDTFLRSDSVYFNFRHIYLPGLQQGIVSDEDSTKGFVQFSLRFKKRPRKIPFSTRAAIAFDGGAPVLTNRATARFIKGLSPGVTAGYNYLPANGGYSAQGPLQVGYVLAPYSPYRPFFQAEGAAELLEQDRQAGAVLKVNQDTTILGGLYVISGRQTITITKRNSLDLTPVHFRYNLNDWVGVGVGVTARISLTEQTIQEQKVYFSSQLLPLHIQSSFTTQTAATRWLGDWTAQPFIDIQVGRVRTGPVVGLRYLRPLEGNLPNRFFLYAGFKL